MNDLYVLYGNPVQVELTVVAESNAEGTTQPVLPFLLNAECIVPQKVLSVAVVKGCS